MSQVSGPKRYRAFLESVDSRRIEAIEELRDAAIAKATEELQGKIEDAALDFRDLVEDESSAALEILGLADEKIVLFQRPGIRVVITSEEICFEGEVRHLRTFGVNYDEKDNEYVTGIKAAIATHGGLFKNLEPSACVLKIQEALDAIAEKLQEKLENNELDLIPEELKPVAASAQDPMLIQQ